MINLNTSRLVFMKIIEFKKYYLKLDFKFRIGTINSIEDRIMPDPSFNKIKISNNSKMF